MRGGTLSQRLARDRCLTRVQRFPREGCCSTPFLCLLVLEAALLAPYTPCMPGVLFRVLRRGVALRPYQADGVGWLLFLLRSGLHGALCDDMGLGKTLQARSLTMRILYAWASRLSLCLRVCCFACNRSWLRLASIGTPWTPQRPPLLRSLWRGLRRKALGSGGASIPKQRNTRQTRQRRRRVRRQGSRDGRGDVWSCARRLWWATGAPRQRRSGVWKCCGHRRRQLVLVVAT